MLPKSLRLMVLRVLIFALPLNVGYLYMFEVGYDMLFAFDACLLVLYADWLVHFVSGRKKRPFIPKTFTPGVMMVVWATVSLIAAISLRATIFATIMVIKAIAFHLYFVNNIDTRKELKLVVFWLILGLVFQDFLSLYQRIAGRALGLQFFTDRVRAGALPDDGIVERLTGFTIPNHSGFALVGNADGLKILSATSWEISSRLPG